jgi:AbrB family looped-hinge helix DNA binding protein
MNSQITTVTQKGQVTIPASIRKLLGIQPKQKVEFNYSNGQVTISPVKDFLDFGGTISTPAKNKNKDLNSFLKAKRKAIYERKLKNP